MVRLIVLKDRRIGVSTYVEGRVFHQTVTIPNTNAYIITHDKPSLSKIFGMSKLFWDELPKPFRPMKRYDNSTILRFENPVEKLRLTNPGLRSMIEVFPAKTGNASRAGGYQIAHLSEVAFYDDAETLVTATVPSIPDNPGTIKVLESTGNGRSGYFYEQWRKAKKSLTSTRKLSNFYPVFFGWLTFPEYTKPFLSDREKKDFVGTLDEEETYILQKFGATLEQLNWRRGKILDFDDDIDKFHQEFPLDDEEAFVSKGTPYFSKKKLLQLRATCSDPIKRGDVVEQVGGIGFIENEDGPLKVWEFPESGADYVAAADVGEGLLTSDFSVVQILKAPKDSPIIKQVAVWKGLIDPIMLASKIAELGNWYNEAKAVPETKHPGIATLMELKKIYWNIYQWEFFDRFNQYRSTKLGWETNQGTKPTLCQYCATCIMAGIVQINDEETVDEMLTFVRNQTNSGEADYGTHDDLVMAYMIGLFTVGSSYQVGSILQHLGHFQEAEAKKPERPDMRKRSYGRVAHDEDYFDDDQLVDTGDRGWMSY